MSKKRGQISLFILMTIVVLILFGFLFYLKAAELYKIKEEVKKEIPSSFYSQSVKNLVENCIKQTGIEAIDVLGYQGGYIIYLDNSLITYYSVIAYAYDEGENVFLLKEEMQNQISLYVNLTLPICTNFSNLKGTEVLASENIDIDTLIRENDVLVKVNYPLEIIIGNDKIKISEFLASLPIRLGHIYDIVYSTVENQVKDPGWVDLTFMSDFDINYTIYLYDTNNLIYSISDNKSVIDNEPYTFVFANRFKEVEDE